MYIQKNNPFIKKISPIKLEGESCPAPEVSPTSNTGRRKIKSSGNRCRGKTGKKILKGIKTALGIGLGAAVVGAIIKNKKKKN